jgi:hypothetical protein
VPDKLYISYGPYFISRCSTIDFQQPVNVFAKIESDLDKLENIGKRTLTRGAEMVQFSLSDE